MKKQIFFAVGLLLSAIGGVVSLAFGEDQVPQVGEVYRVNSKGGVPVFSKAGIDFKYEVGFRGTNCFDLDTVLLPGFYVKVVSQLKDGIFEIVATLNNSYRVSGYVHTHFFQNGSMVRCEDVDFDSLSAEIHVPSVQKIVEKSKAIIESGTPFCWGCASFEEISVGALYRFHEVDLIGGRHGPYVCRGFDCSGMLYYLSNGYLPHSTQKIIEFCNEYGKELFRIKWNEGVPQSRLNEIMRELKDTDLVCFSASKTGQVRVIMAYRLGFIEAGGKNVGIVRSPRSEAEARLAFILKCAQSLETDLHIMRWHPDLL